MLAFILLFKMYVQKQNAEIIFTGWVQSQKNPNFERGHHIEGICCFLKNPHH